MTNKKNLLNENTCCQGNKIKFCATIIIFIVIVIILIGSFMYTLSIQLANKNYETQNSYLLMKLKQCDEKVTQLLEENGIDNIYSGSNTDSQ